MDEKEFKKHLKDLAHGHHPPRGARLGTGRQGARAEGTGEGDPVAPAKKQYHTESETAVQNCVTRNPFSSIV